MRTFLVGVVVLLGVGLGAPFAHATADARERAADSQLTAQVRVAVNYWATQGVTGCPNGIAAHFYDDLMSEDGSEHALGHASDCEIWIDSGAAREAREGGPRWWRVLAANGECGLVAHEVGHALGLNHTETGVMSEDAEQRDMAIPASCKAWAWRWFPRPLGVIVKRRLHSIRFG